MKSIDDTSDHIGGPYPEEILLEAYNLEWEAIELRRQRLRKTWQQFLLMEEMEQEERRYQRQLRRLKREEQEKAAREMAERKQAEALRHQQEKEDEDRNREMERSEAEKLKKKLKQVTVNGTTDEQEIVPVQKRKKEKKAVKPKVSKAKPQSKQKQAPKVKPALPKRITPINVPSGQPEDDDSVIEEAPHELGGYDSPPPELPDDGLLDMLMLDKESDSDIDDEPSMVSLILPVAQDSPKRIQPSPLKKKTLTPQKQFARKKGGPPLDFNFTNAEAKRQAKAAEAAQAEQEEAGQEESDEPDTEPVPEPSVTTPKKHLKRRKDTTKGVQKANEGKSLMAAMANSTITVKSKKGAAKSVADKTASKTAIRKKNTEDKAKAKASDEEEASSAVPRPNKRVGGKTETMSIKQRLANAELLARMNKMQDMNTPKVLGKKVKKTQKQGAAQTLAAQRAEFRKILANDATEPGIPRRDQMIEEGDLNISLNSSGLISEDSPENLRAPTRKRQRGEDDGDVTPTKKLQFLEITKRLVKSPMPRFLRTPTPLMSPVVASGLVKSRAASPGPRPASARSAATKDNGTRRLNSAPVRPKKSTNANRFGVPAGGASTATNGGSFSMFDAFVNSGSSGAIPRLKTKTRGDASPPV